MKQLKCGGVTIAFCLSLSNAFAQVSPPDEQQRMPVKDSVIRLDVSKGQKIPLGARAALLDRTTGPTSRYVSATFKSTRIINGQSVENQAAGELDFIIMHRFGKVNQGAKEFFGFDNANTRIGFEYGWFRWLTLGFGRSSYQKEYDGFARVRLWQQTADNHMPVTISYAGTAMVRSEKVNHTDTLTPYFFSNRLSFANQLLIARKFSDRLSLQLSPTHIHYNLVRDANDANDVFSLGIGGRLKLTRRFAVTGEYFYTIPGARLAGYRNSASLGVEIETGGHIFQLQFTNSTGMSERTFVGQTSDRWEDGGIHFGFNIHRVFTIVKPRENS